MFSFNEVVKSYNAIITILKAEADPEGNHSAKIVADRMKINNLSEFEAEVVKENLMTEDEKNIISPYKFEYTGNNIFLFIKPKEVEDIIMYYVKSMFKDYPNNIYIGVDRQLFTFDIAGHEEEKTQSVIWTYFDIFDSILLDQFAPMKDRKTIIVEEAYTLFFTILFMKTITLINDEEINLFLKTYSHLATSDALEETLNQDISIDYSGILDDVVVFLNHNVSSSRTPIRETGYLNVEDMYLANYINKVCDKYSDII